MLLVTLCQLVFDEGRRQLRSANSKDVSSEGPAAAMEIDASLLQVRGCGTVCQLIRDKLTLTLNSLNRS